MGVTENWKERPWDPYSIFENGEDYNPKGIKRITKEIHGFYFLYDRCFTCRLQAELDGAPDCWWGNGGPCKFRLHYMDSEKKYPVVETLTHSRWSSSIFLRRGVLAWLYDRDCPFILRPNRRNKLILHHLNGDPFDDRPDKVCMTDKHSTIHGTKRRLYHITRHTEKMLEDTLPALKSYAYSIVKAEQEMAEVLEQLPDSPKVSQEIRKATIILRERGLLV